LIAAIIFFMILGFIGYDFSRKTTFPGQKSTAPADTLKVDSLQRHN